jgi:hypothetical protein
MAEWLGMDALTPPAGWWTGSAKWITSRRAWDFFYEQEMSGWLSFRRLGSGTCSLI